MMPLRQVPAAQSCKKYEAAGRPAAGQPLKPECIRNDILNSGTNLRLPSYIAGAACRTASRKAFSVRVSRASSG